MTKQPSRMTSDPGSPAARGIDDPTGARRRLFGSAANDAGEAVYHEAPAHVNSIVSAAAGGSTAAAFVALVAVRVDEDNRGELTAATATTRREGPLH